MFACCQGGLVLQIQNSVRCVLPVTEEASRVLCPGQLGSDFSDVQVTCALSSVTRSALILGRAGKHEGRGVARPPETLGGLGVPGSGALSGS